MRAIALRPALAAALVLATTPALAVGLGPLAKEGYTRGPHKAFFLNLINPYDDVRTFKATAYDADGGIAERVEIRPALARLAGRRVRRLVVVARDLAPGEELTFTVCAEEAEFRRETIHARVCSKLTARRLGAAA